MRAFKIGRPGVIDRAIDGFARRLEQVLALALVAAVLLNFANVIGRYLLGVSLIWADEVQVFIMVALTFLGSAIVTRRHQHLRMDVLVRLLPARARAILRIVEQVLLTVLIGFVATHSYFYARQIFVVGRTSDMGGIPMWIPHGSVVVGLGLMLVAIGWGLVHMLRPTRPEASGSQPVAPALNAAVGGEVKP